MSDGGNLPIGPGIWGFLAFFVLAVALFFLVRNMNARLRRMAYRDRDRAEAAQGADLGADAPADADVARSEGAAPQAGEAARGSDLPDEDGPRDAR